MKRLAVQARRGVPDLVSVRNSAWREDNLTGAEGNLAVGQEQRQLPSEEQETLVVGVVMAGILTSSVHRRNWISQKIRSATPMLDLQRLQIFRRVATLRSFSAAALELSYTQSSVSEAVATLDWV